MKSQMVTFQKSQKLLAENRHERPPIQNIQFQTKAGHETAVLVILGSFCNGNANVRLCVSCANFGSWHSYELETLRTSRIHNGSRQK